MEGASKRVCRTTAKLAAAGTLCLMLASCATTQPVASTALCLQRPTLFDWQALDDQTLLVWVGGKALPQELTLDHRIEGLASDPPGFLELIDGDHDGEICGQGFDSVALWSDQPDPDSGVSAPIGSATIDIVEKLNALALDERLSEHAATLGPRAADRVANEA